jgi:NADPH:quinone reductase-like Zn-dependent oxidoreductase
MKALRLHARGGPEQLFFEDAPTPEPGPDEVRIRVYAAGLTPTELKWDETYRWSDGRPRIPSIPGHDVSGTIDAVGARVTDLAVGDAVFGLIDFPRDGSAAEFVTAPAATLAPKPRTLDHLQSAAVPLSARSAWQALLEHARLEPGGRVLIHGAAGGVGAYAVQLARWRGAHVIATATTRDAGFLKEIGADVVIDYHATRFETAARDVDIVLDTIGGETRERSWEALKPGGTLVTLTGPIDNATGRRDDVKGVFFIVRPSRVQLVEIAGLIDAGVLRPFIEATYALADGRSAFERAAAGHLRGKLMLRVVE